MLKGNVCHDRTRGDRDVHVLNTVDQSGRVGVVGGGTMGVGIAYVFAAGGYHTTVVEPDLQRAATIRGSIGRAADDALRRGKCDSDEAARLVSRVELVGDIAELADGIELVIESVPERFELKVEVLRKIEQLRPAMVATHTSALSITRLAAGLSRPELVVGLHFFNPVWSIPLVEIVRGARTSDTTVVRATAVVDSIGKQAIVVKDSPGFATSRLDLIASLEAMRMLEEGVASAADIDRAMSAGYRHPTGPLRLSDIVGLDVRLDIARNLHAELGDRFAPPQILEELVAAGHLGMKSGRGFFDWSSETAV